MSIPIFILILISALLSGCANGNALSDAGSETTSSAVYAATPGQNAEKTSAHTNAQEHNAGKTSARTNAPEHNTGKTSAHTNAPEHNAAETTTHTKVPEQMAEPDEKPMQNTTVPMSRARGASSTTAPAQPQKSSPARTNPPTTKAPTTKPPKIPSPLVIDLSGGKNSNCFSGLSAETLSITVASKSGGGSYVFEGVYLSRVFSKLGVTSYKKIEAVTRDIGTVDITNDYKSGDIMLAWKESKNGGAFINENPIRICPQNATTADKLIKQVVQIVVTI